MKLLAFIFERPSYFSLVGNYLRPSNNSRLLNFNINTVVFIVITC